MEETLTSAASSPHLIKRTMSSSSNSAIPLNLEVETTESLTAVAGHICVSYRGCLICWGGYCYDEREIHYRECNWLYIFPYTLCGARNNVWLKVQCETDLQLRPNSGATAGVHRDQLYIFGGCLFDDTHRRMVNTSVLLAIDLRTGALRAKQYPPNRCIPTPRDKTTSWIAHDKFFIFGGYGISWYRLDHSNTEYFFKPQSFLDDDMGSCWNNQLLYYDLKKECWFEVDQKGNKPSQRAAAASVYVPEVDQVFLFGGRHDQNRLNDLYMLDLSTLIWTQIESPSTNPSPSSGLPLRIPEGRSWCTMVLLSQQKKILCYGGLCSRGLPLSDLWELDIGDLYNGQEEMDSEQEGEEKKAPILKRPHWRQIPPLEHQMPARLWHCSVLLNNEAILVYGGMNQAPSHISPFVRTLLIKPLQPPSLRQLALNALVDCIIEGWMAETDTREKTASTSTGYNHRLPFFDQNPSLPLHHQMDIQCFAKAAGFMANLPGPLHPHLRILLSIRKHAKALNPAGGNTPRGTSPYRWQPAPVNFHLLNLDGMRREGGGDDEEEERAPFANQFDAHWGNQLDVFGIVADNWHLHRHHACWNVPLSPKSQKRALADELVKQICENAKCWGVPFFHALFQSFDPI